jgi:hypothetical protein
MKDWDSTAGKNAWKELGERPLQSLEEGKTYWKEMKYDGMRPKY